MSPRNWWERVDDMLACARNIRSFTARMDFDAFLNSPQTIRAVAYEITTIGEAAHSIPDEVKERYPQIPWGKMYGIRNVLIHEYFRLDEEILWTTSQEDIPALIEALEKMIDEG
jgi:uncharacterized protein with HEPN domain